eukprot:TRINITY_DN9201_c0_g1_i1.p1 TRINITY_DN9201_c0_g1~~TRINITY_DN9201_c0_g1_i1.p1  ORF type:complete len:381 (-),score=140.42 TRINITY_DN9201_c0_g1_i1:65-1207(-)
MDSNVNPAHQTSEDNVTPQDYLRQIKENYPDLKHSLELNVFQGVDGEEKTITVEDLIKKKENAFYFKNNKNSTFKFARNVASVKIMIEHCENCKFLLQGPILTTVVEIWRCDNTKVLVDTQVNTLQVDLNNNLEITYKHKKFLGSLVQAGIHGLSIKFEDHPELDFESGYDVLVKETPEINDQTDQFITRFVEGELLTEEIIRYADGYHTTEREKAARDDELIKNASKEEEKVREMLKFSQPVMDKVAEDKKNEKANVELEKKSNLKKAAGNKQLTKGNLEEAIKSYGEAMTFTPDNHVLYSNRAQAYIQQEKFVEALADVDKCIELSPAFTKAYYRRGVILTSLDRIEEAVAALQEAHDLAPRDEEIEKLLAETKTKLK